MIPRKSIIEKESLKVLVEAYKTPNTIPLAFSFEPLESLNRTLALKKWDDGLFVLNDFFSDEEGKDLRDFSLSTTFSQKIYGNEMSEAQGEVPAKMMNGKERWEFFHQPPLAIGALFDLFGYLAHETGARVITLPWCLSDQKTTSNCVATNFLTENASLSAEYGKHQDYNPANGLAFAIPCLYDEGKEFDRFNNGAIGHPLMLTVMVYATAENYLPEHGMGTLFYSQNGEEMKVACQQSQIVIFEGDIWHTIEPSQTPAGCATWRVSYVFKIILNPRKKDQCMRTALTDALLKKTTNKQRP